MNMLCCLLFRLTHKRWELLGFNLPLIFSLKKPFPLRRRSMIFQILCSRVFGYKQSLCKVKVVVRGYIRVFQAQQTATSRTRIGFSSRLSPVNLLGCLVDFGLLYHLMMDHYDHRRIKERSRKKIDMNGRCL